nr:phage tail length tape measure family protein [Pseudosulfitobacter pseudonitzschiae]
MKGIGDEAKKAGAEAEGFGRKGRGAGKGAKELGDQTTFAAGSVSNLTAQFNDIGVMLAAGQNPLQLAIQQGTQITQVFGNTGAAQAGMMLKQALVSMISPLNLITIGAIAGGAALVQWATSAGSANDKADNFEKQLEDLDAAISDYAKSADIALMTTEQLNERFGSASAGLQLTIDLLEQISRNEAQRSIDQIASSLGELMEISGVPGRSRTGVQDFFDLDISFAVTDKQRAMRSQAMELTAEFLNQQKALKGAAGDLDRQIEITRELLSTTQQLAEIKDGISTAEEAVIKQIAETLVKMEQQRGKVKEVEDGVDGVTKATIAAAAAAQKLIQGLQSEADIQRLIAQYGEDSRQVAEARVAEERRVYAATKLTADMSQDMKDEIMKAWDAANGMASVDMATAIAAAADQASRMANELGRAVSNAIALANQGVGDVERARINYEFRDDPLGRAGALAGAEFDARTNLPPGTDSTIRNVVEKEKQEFVAARVEAERYNQQLQDWRKEKTAADRAGRGKGRDAARASEREQKAIDDLIVSLKAQREVLSETDPVQKEMIQNRKVLAAATDAERKTVEELIAARVQEEAAIERATENAEFFGDITSSALDSLIVKGESLDDVLKNISGSLIDAGIQAALFGEGPFGSLFGGTSIFSAIFPKQKLAEGGMIYGAGGSRDDKVPLWGSAGEFVVNASATSRNRALLEAINAGAPMQGLARGGMIGGRSSAQLAPMAGGNAPVVINVDVTGARGNTEIMEGVREGIRRGLEEYDRNVLPGRVSEIADSPRYVG